METAALDVEPEILSTKIQTLDIFLWLFYSSVRSKKAKSTSICCISWQPEEETTTEPPPEPVNIRISWRLNQIDYPTCLDYFVVDYYDITYNESTYSRSLTSLFLSLSHRTLGRPFGPTLQMDIGSDSVPCDSEFR